MAQGAQLTELELEKLITDKENLIMNQEKANNILKQEHRVRKDMQKLPGKVSNIFTAQNILYHVGPYIAIVLIVIVVILIVSLKPTRNSKVSKNIRATQNEARGFFGSLGSRIKSFFKTFFGPFLSLLTPSPSMRATMGMFNPYGASTPSIKRNQSGGRCDDLTFASKGGKCYSTVRPADISWKIDNTQLNESVLLPDEEQSKINDLKPIIIPWEVNASFYMPRCDKAHFEGTREGSAAYLYKDNGLSCSLQEKTSTKYDGYTDVASSIHY